MDLLEIVKTDSRLTLENTFVAEGFAWSPGPFFDRLVVGGTTFRSNARGTLVSCSHVRTADEWNVWLNGVSARAFESFLC